MAKNHGKHLFNGTISVLLCELGSATLSVLELRKGRLREVKHLNQDHRAARWESQQPEQVCMTECYEACGSNPQQDAPQAGSSHTTEPSGSQLRWHGCTLFQGAGPRWEDENPLPFSLLPSILPESTCALCTVTRNR